MVPPPSRPTDLVRWLDQSLFQKLPEFTQVQRSSYLAAVVNHLLNEKRIPLVTLAKARFKLAQDIEARVADLKDKGAKAQFRQLVLEEVWAIEPDWTQPLVFEPNRYPVPAATRYAGRYQFGKHFYPVLADLKDGGEEFFCAQLLDNHVKVKHWVRNLDTAPCGFSLATSGAASIQTLWRNCSMGELPWWSTKGRTCSMTLTKLKSARLANFGPATARAGACLDK
jgi:type III restriction enzyme